MRDIHDHQYTRNIQEYPERKQCSRCITQIYHSYATKQCRKYYSHVAELGTCNGPTVRFAQDLTSWRRWTEIVEGSMNLWRLLWLLRSRVEVQNRDSLHVLFKPLHCSCSGFCQIDHQIKATLFFSARDMCEKLLHKKGTADRWVCLKIVYLYTQLLMIIIPTKWLFHWGIPHFQTYPDGRQIRPGCCYIHRL